MRTHIQKKRENFQKICLKIQREYFSLFIRNELFDRKSANTNTASAGKFNIFVFNDDSPHKILSHWKMFWWKNHVFSHTSIFQPFLWRTFHHAHMFHTWWISRFLIRLSCIKIFEWQLKQFLNRMSFSRWLASGISSRQGDRWTTPCVNLVLISPKKAEEKRRVQIYGSSISWERHNQHRLKKLRSKWGLV